MALADQHAQADIVAFRPLGLLNPAVAMTETVAELLKINNQFYSHLPLSISYGTATSETGEKLEAVIRRADAAMYEHQRRHSESRTAERAGKSASAA